MDFPLCPFAALFPFPATQLRGGGQGEGCTSTFVPVILHSRRFYWQRVFSPIFISGTERLWRSLTCMNLKGISCLVLALVLGIVATHAQISIPDPGLNAA